MDRRIALSKINCNGYVSQLKISLAKKQQLTDAYSSTYKMIKFLFLGVILDDLRFRLYMISITIGMKSFRMMNFQLIYIGLMISLNLTNQASTSDLL